MCKKPFTKEEVELLVFSGGLYVDNYTWMGKFSSLYTMNYFNMTVRAASDSDKLAWYEYFKKK